MVNDIREYLPIGTVITLKNGTKRLMIFGIIQNTEEDETTKQYDYIGVPYPEGNIGSDYQYLFNHEDVEVVYFRGFEDVERQEFIANLVELYSQHPEFKAIKK